MPTVIKEGRAALVTSVGIFKYMAAYSLVQFASVLILYSIDSNLTDIQYLYIDLFIISVTAFFFGKTESYDGPLVKQTPLASLVSLSPVASLVIHLVLAIAFQGIGYAHLQAQPWYQPFEYNDETAHLGCFENYTIFVISCFQYMILALVFSKGRPYRKAIVTNFGLLAALVVNVAFSVYLTLQPVDNPVARFFELIVPPTIEFRVYVLLYGAANLLLSVLVETLVIDVLFFRKLRYRFHNVEKSRRRFLAVENTLRQEPAWPPLSLYQTVATGSVDGDLGVPGPGADGVDICVETDLGVDMGPMFGESNTNVLNSFFDAYEEEKREEMERMRQAALLHDAGLLEPIDEVDSNVTPTELAAGSPPKETAATATSSPIVIPSAAKHISRLDVNLEPQQLGASAPALNAVEADAPQVNGHHSNSS